MFTSYQEQPVIKEPRIIARPDHSISRENISSNALKVLYRLKKAGYQSYLVGGCVRDLLLGHEPKDFDVTTDATPEQVKALFSNCRLIGRRFRLAHVCYGRDVIEVATFRGHGEEETEHRSQSDEGRLLRDNVFGCIEEDAWRRDFTVNALYYNIADFSIVDYTNGLEDIKTGTLRMIGDAENRYREDPVRMLRAVRFAAKLGFRLHADSEKPIPAVADLLQDVSPSRLFDEMLKMFMGGKALQTWELMQHYGLFAPLFPLTARSLETEDHEFPKVMIARALENTDTRIAEGKPVTPAFLFAALLWEGVRDKVNRLHSEEKLSAIQALQIAGADIVSQQSRHISIPKRFSMPMREIWAMQARLGQHAGQRPLRLMGHPRFRAAYDFLLLRAEAGEVEMSEADWWTEFQKMNPVEQKQRVMTKGKRGRRRRKPSAGKQADSKDS